MKEQENEFMSVKETAQYLRISTAKVFQLKATDKSFPYHKIGERLLFNRNELKEWVIAH